MSDDLFDESRLRLALRLDSSELPPGLDAAAIARLALVRRPVAVATVASAGVAGAATAVLLASLAVAAGALVPAIASGALGGAIGLLAQIAIAVESTVQRLEEPTMPLAAIAGLAVAIVYEYRQRRERVHVHNAA